MPLADLLLYLVRSASAPIWGRASTLRASRFGCPPLARTDRRTAALASTGGSASGSPNVPGAHSPGGVSRWVGANGKISLAGFSYHVGASYAGEPVEVAVAWWTSCTPGSWSPLARQIC